MALAWQESKRGCNVATPVKYGVFRLFLWENRLVPVLF